ncbi:MAG: hypothetical protein RLZZ401_194 [Pseudomonadota bacterium]|jgi:acyl-CoA dehydrogenase
MSSSNVRSDFHSWLNALTAPSVAGEHAASVDAQARFPGEAVNAFKKEGLLSAPLPVSAGGIGLTLREQGELVGRVAEHCGSSAMVLAMHYNQLACVARHGLGTPFFDQFAADLVRQQLLLASITSENGTFGETRTSVCAVLVNGARFTLDKDATTGSYCEHADAILVTSRRNAEAGPSDQALTLALKGQYTLQQTTQWDTMGMRGTCSPGFLFSAEGPAEQVWPVGYGDIAALSMVPFSHILWSALWCGLAAAAHAKAAMVVRNQARKNPGVVPPTANRLAELTVKLQALRHNWQSVANEFDELVAQGRDRQVLTEIAWALKLNNLKIASSDAAPRLVHDALQILGIPGYSNQGPLSVSRIYRDALSGSLMIANDRIAGKSAALLLVHKHR